MEVCLSSCNEIWEKKRVSLCIKRIQNLYKLLCLLCFEFEEICSLSLIRYEIGGY